MTYMEWAAGIRASYQPATADVVDWPSEGMLILEGDAAADSMRRWVSGEERRALELAGLSFAPQQEQV
jgi:hypothetical protein